MITNICDIGYTPSSETSKYCNVNSKTLYVYLVFNEPCFRPTTTKLKNNYWNLENNINIQVNHESESTNKTMERTRKCQLTKSILFILYQWCKCQYKRTVIDKND